jgi:hypothetical protein
VQRQFRLSLQSFLAGFYFLSLREGWGEVSQKSISTPSSSPSSVSSLGSMQELNAK